MRLQLFDENVSRMTGGLDQRPVWYYILPLLTLGLPWTLALPGAVAGESALPLRARRFLWIWVIVMFVFFSVALGKRHVYILPLRPALAILLAGWLVPQLERLRGLPRPRRDAACGARSHCGAGHRRARGRAGVSAGAWRRSARRRSSGAIGGDSTCRNTWCPP